jgi:hypothetical protein
MDNESNPIEEPITVVEVGSKGLESQDHGPSFLSGPGGIHVRRDRLSLTQYRQIEASKAASKVLEAGGTLEEAEAKAKEVWTSIRAQERSTSTASGPTPELRSRYFKAIARVLHGQFDDLTDMELYDIACLSKFGMNTFANWSTMVQEGEKLIYGSAEASHPE